MPFKTSEKRMWRLGPIMSEIKRCDLFLLLEGKCFFQAAFFQRSNWHPFALLVVMCVVSVNTG